MAATGNSLEPQLSNVVMHIIKHYDSNFSGEFIHLGSIILLICQQRFIFNVFNGFYFVHKNAFFNVFFILGLNVFNIYVCKPTNHL